MAKSYLFFGVDMRIGVPGIVHMVESRRIKLKKGDIVICFNNKKTLIKLLASDKQTLLYHREQRPIDPAAIPYIPLAFNGKELRFSKAIAKRIHDYFNKKGRK